MGATNGPSDGRTNGRSDRTAPGATRVLVVDDERTIAELIRDVLAHRGLSASTSTGGEDALRQAVEGDYRLVISDFAIPGMNGLEFVRRFRQAKPDGSVIIVSAFLDGETIDQLRAVGNVVGLIRKPFDIFDLARRVERFFAGGTSSASPSSDAAAETVPVTPTRSRAPVGESALIREAPARRPFYLEGM